MGKKLDFLLGRASRKIIKLKTLLNLTVSRLAILRNHRQVRRSQARGDVAELLQLGYIEHALLRVEHVIKEQNMLEVFVMIESYCHLVVERAVLLEDQKECPEELREAISSLVFAASRSGELPELQSVRYTFASIFGKEFTTAAVELRNNCGVNPKMIQKLSTKQPTLEIRQRVTKEIAAEKGIKLDFDEPSDEFPEVDPNSKQRGDQSLPVMNLSSDNIHELPPLEQDENLSLGARQKYKDVVTAAQAAYKSAQYAAEAARVAVELSRSESQGKDSGDQSKPDGGREAELHERTRNEEETLTGARDVEKIHPVQSYSSESEEEIPAHNNSLLQEERPRAPNELGFPSSKGKEILFDKSDGEAEKDRNLGANPLPTTSRNGHGNQIRRQFELASDDSDKKRGSCIQPPYRRNPARSDANNSLHDEIEMDKKGWGSKTEGNTATYYSEVRSRTESVYPDPAIGLPMQHSNEGKKVVSVRTRRGF